MSAGQETIYLQDRNVLITNTRAIMAGHTFAMANVTSVSMTSNTASPLPVLISLGVGAVGAMYGSIYAAVASLSLWPLFLGPVCCAALVILGWLLLSSETMITYAVRIGSSGGEANVLASKDQAYVQRIVDAMNEAIIQRG